MTYFKRLVEWTFCYHVNLSSHLLWGSFKLLPLYELVLWISDPHTKMLSPVCETVSSSCMGCIILPRGRRPLYVGRFNSLAPGKFELNFRYVIFKWILVIDGWGISCEISLIWISLDFADDLSTLVQVMAWCHQATSHYLNQCWPRSPMPYGVTRHQWVNGEILIKCRFCYSLKVIGWHFNFCGSQQHRCWCLANSDNRSV